MPFTIHHAATEEEARTHTPDLSWDYQTHQQIFLFDGADLHDLSLFHLLSDYRENASFLGADVITLRAEVEAARARIHHPRATEALARLIRLCEAAIRTGGSLFAFGEPLR